jgi:hypothetical protein
MEDLAAVSNIVTTLDTKLLLWKFDESIGECHCFSKRRNEAAAKSPLAFWDISVLRLATYRHLPAGAVSPCHYHSSGYILNREI